MEYQVPQFIEVEDKIVGPLTLKQFIYLAGAAGLCVVFFAYLHILLAFICSGLVVALASALAFYKVNGKPFIQVLEAGFNYYLGGKLFLWKHQDASTSEKSAAAATAAAAEAALLASKKAPRITRGKLAELAFSLDTKTSSGEVPPHKTI